MYILTNISFVDLMIVCLITLACLVTMVGIIIVSSKSSTKKKKENVEIKVAYEKPKKEEIKAIPKKNDVVNSKKEVKVTKIEDVLEKLEEEMEKGPKKQTHTFEELQEEKAIISYRELLKVAGKLKEENEKIDDELEKASIPKTKNVLENAEQYEVQEERQEKPKDEKKFKSSEIISPVYGRIQKDEANMENDNFLNDLKDLRKNLE